jgi:DNA-binding MarR family transcriptional regulator
VNAQAFLQLDRVIHEKGRLAIMSMLAATPELSFTELRDTLKMTDGNLTTHIRTLQEAGYVSVTKSFQNNRPLTTCSLTSPGKKAFTNYINLLEQIIQQTKPK